MMLAIFLMSMSPRSARPWKHVTRKFWVGMAVYTLAYPGVVMADHANLQDNVFIIWPIMGGMELLAGNLSINKDEDTGLITLDAEEKQS